MIDNPPFILRENLRNTASIHDWATERTNLGKDIITNQIVGPIPLSYKFAKDYEAKKHIETEILKLVDEDKVPISSIVILSFGSLRIISLIRLRERWMVRIRESSGG